MPIAFQCPNCGKQFKLDDSLAGKTAKCPCGTMIAIPGGSGQTVTAAPTPAPTEDIPVLTPRPDTTQAAPQAAQPAQPTAAASFPPAQPAPNPNLTPIQPGAAPQPYAAPVAQAFPAPVAQAYPQAQPGYPAYAAPGRVMTTGDIMLLVAGILGAIHGGVNVIFHGIDLINAIRNLSRLAGRMSSSSTVHSILQLILNVGLLALAGIILACAIGMLIRKRWGISIGGPIAIAYIAVIAVQTVYLIVLISRIRLLIVSDRIVWYVIRCLLLIAAPIYWIVVYAMKPHK